MKVKLLNALDGWKRHGLGAIMPPYALRGLAALTPTQTSEANRVLLALDQALTQAETALNEAKRADRVGPLDFARLNDERANLTQEVARLTEVLSRVETAESYQSWMRDVWATSEAIDDFMRTVAVAVDPSVRTRRFAIVAVGSVVVLGGGALTYLWWTRWRKGKR